MNNPGKASLPVIKRLPKYYRYLRTLKNDGITSISSRELAAQMGTTASQVRQDFNCIGDVNAAFDNSPSEVGKEINGIQILHVDELEAFCAEHKPEVAVFCVPRSGAEELSGRLVELGIKGFWNFSHYDLSVPYPEVVVENVHLGDSLMSLGYRLRNQD